MVSDLVNSLLKDAKKNKDYLGGRKGESSLSPSQLNEAAILNKEFMDNLTVRKKDIPDALKTRFGRKAPKYDPAKAFEKAYVAMGANLTASIKSVLDALSKEASNVQRYQPTAPKEDWKRRLRLSTDAFTQMILASESANIETSNAFMGLKQQMRMIGQEIEGLRGLPADTTPQLKALHEAITKFESISSSQEFDALFTLKPRKTDLTPIDRLPGAAGYGQTNQSPLARLEKMRTATRQQKQHRKQYWRQWIGCFDILLLATEALQYYLTLGFNLKPNKKRWLGAGALLPRPTVVSYLKARDDLLNQLLTTLKAGAIPLGPDTARKIERLNKPSLEGFFSVAGTRFLTDESLSEHIKYINDIIEELSTMYSLII
jgi:hypothetical protein